VQAKLGYSVWGIPTVTNYGGYEGSGDISYTGKERDQTGLYYFNARYYDASIGRFITEDPARNGMNWFVYCGNNPLSATDPTGLAEIICDDIQGNPVIDIYGKDLISRINVEIIRNNEDGQDNDQARIKIGTQIVLVINGVQSEKNQNVGGGGDPRTRSNPDYSDPNSPCATLPLGIYIAIRTKGTLTHPDASRITSDSVQLPGFEEKGIKDFFGFLIHSYSDNNGIRTVGWSLGCIVMPDQGFKDFNNTLGSLGVGYGIAYQLAIR